MAYATRVSYKVTPGQREFDVTFPYLAVSHVEVLLSNVPLPWAAYDWIGTSRVKLKVDPGAGNTVTLRRRTPLNDAFVKFRNGSVLSEEELNNSVLQILYVQQELTDLYENALDKAQVRLGDNLGIVTDPDAVMDELVQMVLADELMEDFNSRLADVNLNAQTLIEEQLRSHNLKLGVNVIRDKVSTLETASELAASVLDLLAIVSEDGESLTLREDKVYRGNGQSLAQSFTAIQTNIADVTAGITTLEQTIVGPDGALTKLQQSLGASDPNGGGFILNDLGVRYADGTVQTNVFSGLSARIGDAEAGIVTSMEAIATETEARAAALSTLTARVGTAESSISSTNQVVAGISARAGVSLNVNGYVTGWIANNNGSSGSLVVVQDRFAVVHPNGGAPIVPFEVSNGWLIAPRIRAGDVYANTITTNHLIVGGVTTEKIAANAVTNGGSAHTEGTVRCNVGETMLQAVGLNTLAGSRVQMQFAAYVNPVTFSQGGDPSPQRNIVWFRVYRNSVYIGRFLAGAAVLTGGSMLLPGGLASLVFSDSPPAAGWQTYQINCEVVMTAGFPGFTDVSSRGLNVLETKR
jgi:hypothetical protein